MMGSSIRNLTVLLLNSRVAILDRLVWLLFLLGEEFENFLFKLKFLSKPNWKAGEPAIFEYATMKMEECIDLDIDLNLEIVNYEEGFGKICVLSKIVENT